MKILVKSLTFAVLLVVTKTGAQPAFPAAGSTASVQVTSNLLSWSTISTVAVTNGTGVFTDATAAKPPARYYRIVQ